MNDKHLLAEYVSNMKARIGGVKFNFSTPDVLGRAEKKGKRAMRRLRKGAVK